MQKKLSIFIAFFLFFVSACSESEREPTPAISNSVSNISEFGELFIPAFFKNQNFILPVSGEWELDIQENDWCTVFPTNGNRSDSLITITIINPAATDTERYVSCSLSEEGKENRVFTIVHGMKHTDREGYYLITTKEAGELPAKEEEQLIDMENVLRLKIKGPLNHADCDYIKEKAKKLKAMDLTNASISYLPVRYFCDFPLQKVILPGGLSNADSLFYYSHESTQAFSMIQTLVFPETNKITSIGDSIFYESNISSVILPKNLNHVGEYAFYGCRSLEEIVLPANIAKLGAGVFKDCVELKRVTLVEKTDTIATTAFEGCIRMEEFICLNPEPPVIAPEEASTPFYGVPLSTCGLKVPEGSLEAYREDPKWGAFSNIYE
ncbi:leucine-rich repeat domain-containing protein [Odoribacter sp. OttesenSCG-928-A06]|nr:leucine-rich repeat domain-containing protein [Odoribacter sp. OttesenSCG-928-A06]